MQLAARSSGKIQNTARPGVTTLTVNLPASSVLAFANDPYSRSRPASAYPTRIRQDRHAFGRLPLGPLDRPAPACRPQLDVLEERPPAQLFVLADHRQGVAEPGPRCVVGVFDVELDIQERSAICSGGMVERIRRHLRRSCAWSPGASCSRCSS